MIRHCPRCKQLRKSTKQLSLTKLPPILLIHLKRFYFQGPFRNKIETYVEFPVNMMNVTSYLPESRTKERFVYDLYAVSASRPG